MKNSQFEQLCCREKAYQKISAAKIRFLLNIYKYLKFMNDKTATLPKNTILNFLYSTDRQISLELLGNWLEKHTEGRYKLVDTHQS